MQQVTIDSESYDINVRYPKIEVACTDCGCSNFRINHHDAYVDQDVVLHEQVHKNGKVAEIILSAICNECGSGYSLILKSEIN